jgi:hypothetical protein
MGKRLHLTQQTEIIRLTNKKQYAYEKAHQKRYGCRIFCR